MVDAVGSEVGCEVGARLKSERERQGLTVRDLADRSKVSFALIYRIESGKGCQLDTFDKLRRALNVSADSLLDPQEATTSQEA